MAMQYNICKTCDAKDGRAGRLINDECLKCYETRKSGDKIIHGFLSRTDDEIKKTFAILDERKGDIQETPKD